MKTSLAPLVGLLCLAATVAAEPTGRVLPVPWSAFSLPIDFAPLGRGDVLVLEDLQRRVAWARESGTVQAVEGLHRPAALAVDEDGLALILDRVGENRWLLKTYRDGRPLGEAALQGDPRPREPVDADAAAGILWVVDRSPPRLFLYAYDGANLGWVDLAPLARAPFSISLGAAGEAFVTDPMGPAVLVFSPSGEYAGSLDLAGTGVTRPTGVAADPLGQVWVSDAVVGHVLCVDSGGEGSGLRCGDELARFRSPLRLEWQDGKLWVLEGDNGRLHWVELE